LRIWWFRDGKAGHERQAMALIGALRERMDVDCDELPAMPAAAALGRLLRGGFLPDLEAPDLLLGAGHATHAGLLAGRRIRGGRAVVLMKPSMPLSWFDLCVIPRHDRPPERANVIETLGPLSPLRPAASRGRDGLLLIGGPSPHFDWDGASLWRQIEALARKSGRHWRLSPSRRTPAGFLEAMPAALGEHIEEVPLDEQSEGWLDETLPAAAECRVTPDSLSMIFDCLAAGVPCGVFHLDSKPGDRVSGAVTRLVEEGRVAPAGSPAKAVTPLDEAGAVANAILERWFK